jgi:Zn-dependent protease
VISFRLAGIPVTIHPSFLLVAALLGLSTGQIELVLAWIGVVFVSILIHELGHAITARSFGAEVAIELNGIGGLTTWSGAEEKLGPGRRAAVAAAGSAVGVVFGLIVWLVAGLTGPYSGVTGFVLNNLVFVNVFWGLLNWLPIRPLDGGHLFTSLLQKIAPANAQRISNVVFLVTAAAALGAALWFRLFFVAILAGWLVMGELTRGRPRVPAAPIPPMSFDRPEDIEDVGGESDVGEPETEPELDQPESEPETEPEQADS